MFKKKLVRSSLLHEILSYRKTNIYEKGNIKYFKRYLKIIHRAFKSSKFEKDETFLLKGTRINLIDDFFNTLDNKDNFNTLNNIDDPLYFALENLEKLLLGTNNITAKDVDKSKWTKNEEGIECVDSKFIDELKNTDLSYTKNGIICFEEKELIENMILKFEEKLSVK